MALGWCWAVRRWLSLVEWDGGEVKWGGQKKHLGYWGWGVGVEFHQVALRSVELTGAWERQTLQNKIRTHANRLRDHATSPNTEKSILDQLINN